MATVVKKFPFTGGQQVWQVPASVTSAVWELWGAPGGQGDVFAAGTAGVPGSTGAQAFNRGYARDTVAGLAANKSLVGYTKGSLSVTSGALYYVYVGGAGGYGNVNNGAISSTGNAGPGGYNGGAVGGYAAPGSGALSYGFGPGGGGGGATDVRSGGVALSNRILVSGGGGGQGGAGVTIGTTPVQNPATPAPPFTLDVVPGNGDASGPGYFPNAGAAYGGGGGGASGGAGGVGSNQTADQRSGTNGKGGSQTAGGASGGAVDAGMDAGAAGASGAGGNGGGATAAHWTSNHALAGGGGGGGGYFGGGGGSSGLLTTSDNGFCAGGGGGGSNFINGLFTGTANFAHVQPAGVDGQTGVNGYARVTYVQVPNAPTITGPVTGDYVDVNTPLHLTWLFGSLVTSESQGGFDVGYSGAGLGIWTQLPHPTSTDQFLDIAAGTFSAGTNYDIRVRTYDTHGDVSGYTTITVHAVAVPGAPVITSPANGSTLSVDPFNVTWTVDAGVTETIYRVQALDAAGNVQVDSGDLYSTRVNACTNPSFEASTAGWTTFGGCSLAQSATRSLLPTHSGKISWATGAAQTEGVLFSFATIPGKSYTCSAWVTVDTVGTDPDLIIVALDADATSQLGTPQSVHPTVAGVFVRGSDTFVAQSNTSYLAVLNAGAATSGQVAYVDAALIEYGVNLNTYFDGSNANGNPGTASWQGTTGLSASQLAVTNILAYSVNWPLPSQPITLKVVYADTADQNLYSQPGVSTPIVNLNPPDVPVVVLSIDNDAGTVTLDINNSMGTYSAIYNEVWRADLTNGTPEIKLATLNPSVDFVDYTPVTQTLYAYRVRAYSAIGGFADAT